MFRHGSLYRRGHLRLRGRTALWYKRSPSAITSPWSRISRAACTRSQRRSTPGSRTRMGVGSSVRRGRPGFFFGISPPLPIPRLEGAERGPLYGRGAAVDVADVEDGARERHLRGIREVDISIMGRSD